MQHKVGLIIPHLLQLASIALREIVKSFLIHILCEIQTFEIRWIFAPNLSKSRFRESDSLTTYWKMRFWDYLFNTVFWEMTLKRRQKMSFSSWIIIFWALKPKNSVRAIRRFGYSSKNSTVPTHPRIITTR